MAGREVLQMGVWDGLPKRPLDLPSSRGELSEVRAASEKSYTPSRSHAVRQGYLKHHF